MRKREKGRGAGATHSPIKSLLALSYSLGHNSSTRYSDSIAGFWRAFNFRKASCLEDCITGCHGLFIRRLLLATPASAPYVLTPDPPSHSPCYYFDLALPSSMTGNMEPWKHGLKHDSLKVVVGTLCPPRIV